MAEGRVVEIRNARGPLPLFIVLLKWAVVALGCVMLWRMATGHFDAAQLGLGLVLVVGGSFFGLSDLQAFFDREMKLRLDEQGLLDQREWQPVPVLWGNIARMTARGGGDESGSIELTLVEPAGRKVLVQTTYLEINDKQLARLIHDFAPGVDMDRKVARWVARR